MTLGLGLSILKKNEKRPSVLIELDIDAGSLVFMFIENLLPENRQTFGY